MWRLLYLLSCVAAALVSAQQGNVDLFVTYIDGTPGAQYTVTVKQYSRQLRQFVFFSEHTLDGSIGQIQVAVPQGEVYCIVITDSLGAVVSTEVQDFALDNLFAYQGNPAHVSLGPTGFTITFRFLSGGLENQGFISFVVTTNAVNNAGTEAVTSTQTFPISTTSATLPYLSLNSHHVGIKAVNSATGQEANIGSTGTTFTPPTEPPFSPPTEPPFSPPTEPPFWTPGTDRNVTIQGQGFDSTLLLFDSFLEMIWGGGRNAPAPPETVPPLPPTTVTEIRCPKRLSPVHGQMHHKSGEEMMYHSGVRKNFTCNLGYELHSSEAASRTCQDSGEWTGVEAICTVISCPRPNPTMNALSFVSGTRYRSHRLSACEKGFEFHQTAAPFFQQCNIMGEWMPSALPSCKRVTCPTLKAPSPLKVSHSSLGYGSVAIYSCENGYVLREGSVNKRYCAVDCQETQLLHFKYPRCASPYWNGTHPECVSVTIYSPWTTCSQTCGGGTKHRFRTCLEAYLLTSSCAGPALEAEECNLDACPHEVNDVPTTAEQLEQLLQSNASTTQQAVTTLDQTSTSHTTTTSVPLVNNSNLQSCPAKKCGLLEHRICQNSLNRPRDACSSAALVITDIAFIGNQKRYTKRNCTAANGVREYHVELKIRKEIYRSPRCSFLPDYSEGRYNAIIALRYETDCPCPYIEDNQILLATASCDPERRVLHLHAYSIYRGYTKKAHKNLLARCNWKGNS